MLVVFYSAVRLTVLLFTEAELRAPALCSCDISSKNRKSSQACISHRSGPRCYLFIYSIDSESDRALHGTEASLLICWCLFGGYCHAVKSQVKMYMNPIGVLCYCYKWSICHMSKHFSLHNLYCVFCPIFLPSPQLVVADAFSSLEVSSC